jgi:hypothetical protein
MCFSAAASFTASGVLLVVGIFSLKKTADPKQIPFASIPLTFAVQQFCEGMLWLTLKNPSLLYLQSLFTYLFLVFAQVVWPTLVPLSLLLIEKHRTRKKLLRFLLAMGTLLSVYLAFCLSVYSVNSEIKCNYIHYELGFPASLRIGAACIYLIVTIGTPFASKMKGIWIIGFINLLAFITTNVWFKENLVSVWCFFAAVLSICIILVLHRLNRKYTLI